MKQDVNAQRNVLVIGHRGHPALRPEHTLASYELAIRHGADYIEPDLVATLDGHLVARHENAIAMVNEHDEVIEATTNVAELPQFANRLTSKVVDGKIIRGWFTEDFTLAEIKQLRARERIPLIRPGNTAFNDAFTIPTFEEILILAHQASQATGRVIGVYPETKHPSYFQSIDLALEERLLNVLNQFDMNRAQAPVFVQSFEVANLKAIREQSSVKIIQLIETQGQPFDLASRGDARTYAQMVSPPGLKDIADYAQGIGPHKSLVISSYDHTTPVAGSLVTDAHAHDLLVHVYTVRPENHFLPDVFQSKGANASASSYGNTKDEIISLLEAGIDGFFADSAQTAVPVVRQYLKASRDDELSL